MTNSASQRYSLSPRQSQATNLEAGVVPHWKPECDLYFSCQPGGIVKLIQVPCALAAFACVSIANYGDFVSNFVSFVCIVSFLYSLILLLLYYVHVVEITDSSIKWLRWLNVWKAARLIPEDSFSLYKLRVHKETLFLGLWSILYLPTFGLILFYAVRLGGHQSWIVGTLFSFVAGSAYWADFFMKFKALRRGDKPQLPIDSFYPSQTEDQSDSWNAAPPNERRIVLSERTVAMTRQTLL